MNSRPNHFEKDLSKTGQPFKWFNNSAYFLFCCLPIFQQNLRKRIFLSKPFIKNHLLNWIQNNNSLKYTLHTTACMHQKSKCAHSPQHIAHPGAHRSLLAGFWMTINMYSFSGVTMISCFFERIRRKVRSLVGSMSRTVLRAFAVSWWIRPAPINYKCETGESFSC